MQLDFTNSVQNNELISNPIWGKKRPDTFGP